MAKKQILHINSNKFYYLNIPQSPSQKVQSKIFADEFLRRWRIEPNKTK